VVGNKKWSLLPPDALVDEDLYLKTALRPPSKWTSDHVELLRSQAGLLQCLQKPGEVIVVPHSWWHATTNLGDAVGVGAQVEGGAKGLRSLSMLQKQKGMTIGSTLGLQNMSLLK
jgi:hypothetical protein